LLYGPPLRDAQAVSSTIGVVPHGTSTFRCDSHELNDGG
jgi:hypothetical protein